MLLNFGPEEDTRESLGQHGDQPVNSKWNQPWIFIGRTDVEPGSPNSLATWCEEPTHWKRPWCWERLRDRWEGATEDEIVGWHHWLNGPEFGKTLGDFEV